MIPDTPDLGRLRADRRTKLHRTLAHKDAGAVVLLGTTSERWATGARVVAADQGRAARFRNVAVAVSGDVMPHLFTHTPDGVPDDHPADHVHPGVDLEVEGGAATLVAFVSEHVGAGGRVLLDEWTMPLRRAWASHLPDVAVDDAAVNLMGELKLIKTGDELACIRAAQHLNEQAMLDVYAALRPGLRQCELSGLFLRRVFELGADQNTVDPIWEVMPESVSAGPRSVTGDVVFPTVTTDRVLARGDCGWPGHARSRRGACWSRRPVTSICSTRATTASRRTCRSRTSTPSRGTPRTSWRDWRRSSGWPAPAASGSTASRR